MKILLTGSGSQGENIPVMVLKYKIEVNCLETNLKIAISLQNK